MRTFTNDIIGELGENSDGWILIIRDQTKQRLATQRLSQQDKLATIGRLAAGISHDFNNILAAIMLQTDLMIMQSDNLPDLHKSQLQKNKISINRAKDLISQILDFGRTSSPKTEEIQLIELLDEAIDLFGPMLPASAHLKLDVRSDSCSVNVNKTLMLQVFMNLMLNARDAISAEKGNIKITLKRTRIPKEIDSNNSDEWACVIIEDTGVGMTDDVAQHVFEPFYTTKFAHGGTGLGLAQVYGIIQQHNGFIDFSSKVNIGTKFRIYLPLVNREINSADKPTTSDEHPKTARLLIVEDDIRARESLCEILQISNYLVVPAGNGQEALDILAVDQRFDIVLSDINMPHVNGFELYAELRRRKIDVTFAYMSGYISDDTSLKMARDNVKVLNKPFSVQELLQLLETLVSNIEKRKTRATT